VLHGRLPAEVGALLLRALQAAMEEQPAPDVSCETSAPAPRLGARRADALGVLAESFLAHRAEALNGGERQQIVVHVDAETLRDRSAGRCELEDGPALAAETARRLACDASLVEIVEDEAGEPLNVGRKTRSIPPALRRALKARDQGCRFPGCTHSRYVEGHHIRHWADGGETKLSNLALVCKFHYRLVHEGGIVIRVLDDGALKFLRADGSPYDSPRPDPAYPLPSDWREIVRLACEHHVEITPRTAVTRWRGESMDYGFAVQALLQQANRPSVYASVHTATKSD
jgi:hypothetical protein